MAELLHDACFHLGYRKSETWKFSSVFNISSGESRDVSFVPSCLQSEWPIPSWDEPAGNLGSCIHHLGLNICFDEYNYHDSLQGRLIEGIGYFHFLLPSATHYTGNVFKSSSILLKQIIAREFKTEEQPFDGTKLETFS